MPANEVTAAKEFRCEVCGKKTAWNRKRFCAEHADQCKHERAIYVPTGVDVCNDCGAVW